MKSNQLQSMPSSYGKILACVGGTLLLISTQIAKAEDLNETTPDKHNIHTIAEAVVVKELCGDMFSRSMEKLARIGYDTDAGISCAEKLIHSLSLSKIEESPNILSASEVLWRLVGRALVRPERKEAIRKVLKSVALARDHTLNIQARLALRMLAEEEGTLVLHSEYKLSFPLFFVFHRAGFMLPGFSHVEPDANHPETASVTCSPV